MAEAIAMVLFMNLGQKGIGNTQHPQESRAVL
jgi:hypothetical protein